MRPLRRLIIAALLMSLAACGSENSSESTSTSTSGPQSSSTSATSSFSITANSDGSYTIISNGIPNHAAGPFPNANNPNSIQEQNYHLTTAVPTYVGHQTTAPMGPIGFFLNGIPFYNWSNAQGADAVQNEVFDACQGHPDQRGAYHYHQQSSCLADTPHNEGHIGIALDGFKVYGSKAPDGTTNHVPALDACNGHSHDSYGYHYHVTSQFPYTIYCYQGNYP